MSLFRKPQPFNVKTPVLEAPVIGADGRAFEPRLSASLQRYFTQVTTGFSSPINLFIDLGADATGRLDASVQLNSAIQTILSMGLVGAIYVPAGTYLLSQPIVFPSSCPPIILFGDGAATVFLRGANMPTGMGLFDIQGSSDIEFRDFVVDGNVTVPVGVSYATVAGNPMQPFLTANTSFWIHGGARRIGWKRVRIQHTGGYARLIDPSSGGIRGIQIIECLNENNRPNLFGVDPSDLNYGSWTGGDYVNGDGVTQGDDKVLHDFLVSGSTYRRNTGNCLWSHLYGLTELHTNFQFLGNTFEDCGLDGILVGGVSGGAVESNYFHRVGFICTDDHSRGTPKWGPGVNAVALDSAGVVKGVVYKGNSFTNINGGCMDLDGHSDGAITGSICRIAYPTEAEYDEDQVADFGPPGVGCATYGAQVSNSNNDPVAGSNIEICGNMFVNLPNGSIKLFASRSCHVIGNNIIVPDVPVYPPIGLGNIGTGPYQRSYNNKVQDNAFTYSPGSPQPAVVEDASFAPFSAGDKNYVFGNMPILGNGLATEFLKAPSSSSPHYAETVWFP